MDFLDDEKDFDCDRYPFDEAAGVILMFTNGVLTSSSPDFFLGDWAAGDLCSAEGLGAKGTLSVV